MNDPFSHLTIYGATRYNRHVIFFSIVLDRQGELYSFYEKQSNYSISLHRIVNSGKKEISVKALLVITLSLNTAFTQLRNAGKKEE